MVVLDSFINSNFKKPLNEQITCYFKFKIICTLKKRQNNIDYVWQISINCSENKVGWFSFKWFISITILKCSLFNGRSLFFFKLYYCVFSLCLLVCYRRATPSNEKYIHNEKYSSNINKNIYIWKLLCSCTSCNAIRKTKRSLIICQYQYLQTYILYLLADIHSLLGSTQH